jgi:membrane-associated phospholipid phosphatase/GNAT superfamily N-acetyltransferase
MATYVISPGAWLSGSGLHPEPKSQGGGNAGWHPEPKTSGGGNAGWHPEPKTQGGGNAGWHPEPKTSGGGHAGWHPEPQPPANGNQAAAAAVMAAGLPWRGVDPAWVYQGGARALMAQALERTRSKIVRPADPRFVPPAPGVMQAPTQGPDNAAPLWRWGAEYRVHAVVADLAWRLRVDAGVLKSLPDGLDSLSLPSMSALPTAWRVEQIDKVQRAAVEREDRLPEILAQSDDLWLFFRLVLGVQAATSPILEELMAVAWQWATPLVMALKNDVAALRPVQVAPRVMPVITTPAHGSLPSGHAAMSAMTAEILTALMFDGDTKHARAQQLDRLTRRVAFNRVVAGVHFPVDSAAGYALGRQLAGHFIGWATGQAACKPYVFDPKKQRELTESGTLKPLQRQATPSLRSQPLGLVWDAAVRECKRGGA